MIRKAQLKLGGALLLAMALMPFPANAGTLTIAAASDLQFAMQEILAGFRSAHPDDTVEVIYGSSGKFTTQIANGAPFDMFFSADISYPRVLEQQGLSSGPARPYAVGRIVLWSLKPELGRLSLKELPAAAIRKFAIANPDHAPYGKRAQEALQQAGVWTALAPKLVRGENIAQTAQFIDSGAADAGIVALSLVLSPALRDRGAWTMIPDSWHQPLEQGYLITRRAADNPLAAAFADWIGSGEARTVLRRYGFALPGEEAH
ncbi:MAG: molybdate ABC transporter substrate-binding protein [Gammaproteobacteria bacterium]|nr:molybdate ABC transporter substrate-binding protein [Gammaproteobacteria bacterium]